MLQARLVTEEHNRMVERHLQELRDEVESDRLARSARTPRAPRKLRRAAGGALIAAGHALAA
jgi:hypothetical protein